MNKWEVSFSLVGLNSLWKANKCELHDDENNVIFMFINNLKVAKVQIDINDENRAIAMAKSLINQSLAKFCFAYNDEGYIMKDGYSVKNLNDNLKNIIHVTKTLTLRFNLEEHEKEPKAILSSIKSLHPTEKKVLNLALMYFQLGSYANPFRLEALFSCIQVISKYNLGKDPLNQKNKIISGEIKDEVEKILKTYDDFDKMQFDQDWEICHAERNFGAHGAPSYLIDVEKSNEYENISNKVHLWARRAISSFINHKTFT